MPTDPLTSSSGSAPAGSTAPACGRRSCPGSRRCPRRCPDHLHGERCHLGLGVPRGRGAVVARDPSALAERERVPKRPRLHEADERVVDRAVAVRVELAHDVTDDAGALRERPVRPVAAVEHRVDDAAVDRLQTVTDLRQRTSDDDGHRVVEVRPLHLELQVDLRDAVAGPRCRLPRRARSRAARRRRSRCRQPCGLVTFLVALRSSAGGTGSVGRAGATTGGRDWRRGWHRASRPVLDVEEADVLGVLLDELAVATLDVPHPSASRRRCRDRGGVLERDLQERAGSGFIVVSQSSL